MNQLIKSNLLTIPLDSCKSSISKINISGYSLNNFKTVNPEGYTIICRLGETCDGLNYFPATSKIIIDHNQTSCLVFNNFDQFIPNVAQDLDITREAAMEKAASFFSDKQISIQPTGLQGTVYKIVQSVQNYAPMAYTSEAVSLIKTTGMTGLDIISGAPLTFVGATYIGAVFFSYCGNVIGNNPVGVICNSASFMLSRPMRGVEMVLNGLILRPISNQIGLPLVLNGTQEILAGKGLSVQDYSKIGIAFERIASSKKVKKLKDIYKIIRRKE